MKTEVFEPMEVYHGEGIHRLLQRTCRGHRVSLGNNLERKIFWSLRKHQVRTSVELRQRFGSIFSDKNMS